MYMDELSNIDMNVHFVKLMIFYLSSLIAYNDIVASNIYDSPNDFEDGNLPFL